MTPPYTTRTGLRIGSAYVPPTRCYHDEDALRLQDALLGRKRPLDTDGIVIAVVCGVLAAIPLVHHFFL